MSYWVYSQKRTAASSVLLSYKLYIRPVKKLVLIIIAFQVISSGSFLTESMKIHSLIKHYFDHESGDSPIGIIGFLRLHYFDRNHENADPKNHQSLPLHHTTLQNNIVYNAPSESISIDAFIELASIDLNPNEKTMSSQFNQFSIFQPPRLV